MKLRGSELCRKASIILFFLMCAYFIAQILNDSWATNGFTSFTGRSEIVTVTLSASEQQYQWTLSGAYICYDPDEPPENQNLIKPVVADKERLCGGAHGNSGQQYLPLADNISLAVFGETTLEVAIVDAPYMVDGRDYPQGKAPSHVMIIRKATPLDSTCSKTSEGSPVLTTGVDKVTLWEDAEIHIPITEATLMPFSGKLMVGQSISANTPNQLRSGVVAIYRNISPAIISALNNGSGGPQLISETALFPGDIFDFEDQEKNCLVKTSGYLRAQDDGDVSYLEIVASIQSSDGKAVIQRDTPGTHGPTQKIAIEMKFGDAVVSHPFVVWLGLLVSIFLFVKEAVASWSPESK